MAHLALAAAMVVCALSVSQSGYAMDAMPPMERMPHANMPMRTPPPMDRSCPTPEYYIEHRDDIGLSEAQLMDLRKLGFELRRKKLLKGAAVKALELELTEIVTDPNFSVNDALSKLSDIEKARTELRMEVIKTAARARDFLDAGQKDALKRLLMELPPPGPDNAEPGEGPVMEMDKEEMKQRIMREMMQKNMP